MTDGYTTPEGHYLARALLLPDVLDFAQVLTYLGEWDSATMSESGGKAPARPDLVPQPSKLGNNVLGPYCTVDLSQVGGAKHRSMAVHPTQAVLDVVRDRIVTDDDRLSFRIIAHSGRERALVILEHGYIIGSHWLAYVDVATIPLPERVVPGPHLKAPADNHVPPPQPAQSDRKIWVGCLGCYNNGNLVGEWMDPADYDPADPLASIPRLTTRPDSINPNAKVVICSICGSDDCNRWVMDSEGFDGILDGEVSADHAHQLDALLTEIEDDLPDVPPTVVLEYVKDKTGEMPTEWDGPTQDMVRDSFSGEFEDDKKLAYHVVDQMGIGGQHPVPDEMSMYLDWDLIAREQRMEHTVIERDGRRFYFRDN